ncbi:MAG: hypothetical protein CMA21_03215 [Euryarchaeota archaeon]|nr:hypothetical protein [Euryarchaeota archaeon]
MSQQPSPPGWGLGIDYPQEDEDEPFELNNGGSVIVSFFISNDELLPITVDFTYEVPFEGEFDGPESETIGAGNNKTFSLTIMNIEVGDFSAEATEEFSITGTLVARGSVPQVIPDSREALGQLKIPTIHSLKATLSEPLGPMNSGSDMTLTLEVKNLGNVVDRVGSVEVSDNCPLLATDDGLESLTTKDIPIGGQIQGILTITASQSHPQRNCDIEATISSNGATNSGGSEMSESNVRVSVEPPPTNQGNPEDPEENDDILEEVVSSNLSFVGILPVVSVILLASMNKKR